MLPTSRRPVLRALVVLAALVVSLLAVVAPASAATDTDKDGLPDSWEKKGGKAPGGLDIYKLGARYNHKDVFVELNYTQATFSKKVTCAGLDALYTAFAKAPVTNGDKTKGIRLHIDAGKTCTTRKYNLGGSGLVSYSATTSADGFIHPTSAGLATTRKRVFHNGIVAEDSKLAAAEGEAFDADFVVKHRGGGTAWSFVTLHELGHTFGLHHGPIRGLNVMSGGAFAYGTNGQTPDLDFSRYPIQSIDENNLDESKGFTTGSVMGDDHIKKFYAPQFCAQQLQLQGRATGPVDWDCSGSPFWVPPYSQYISATPVSADIDGDGFTTVLPAIPAEWPYVLTHLSNGRIG